MVIQNVMSFSCSDEFENKIKASAGNHSISAWIREACEQRLEREKNGILRS